MTELEGRLSRIVQALADLRRGFALVGGVAVSARTEPRFTRDVDLAVAATSDRDAESLLAALHNRGWLVTTLVEQEAAGRLGTARMVEPARDPSGGVTDLLFASSGIEQEIAGLAEPLAVFPEVAVPVARVGHLIAMKLLARDDRSRPQDGVDLRALLGVAGPDDLALARQACEQIVARGFARGRDLPALLRRALEL